MKKQTFQIANISCGHCTMTIENELKEMDGVANVSSNIGDKSVTIEWQDPANEASIRALLNEINYPAS
jgi:copper chaperone CopZ